MIKKIKCLFVGTLIMFSMPVGVLAEEDATTTVEAVPTLYNDVETSEPVLISEEIETSEDESIKVIKEEKREPRKELRDGDRKPNKSKSSKFENEVRVEYMFESLANRIEVQVESAQIISDKADELGKDIDFSEIIASMDSLIEEAEMYELDVNISSEITKEDFESIKDRAKELSKEFKELAKDLFTEEEKDSIKEDLKAVKEANKQEHKAEVQNMKNAIQLESAKKLLERMGIDATEILTKIESGEISPDQIKSELRNLYKSISEDKKKELVQKYKEENVKRKIEYKEKRDEIKSQIDERKKATQQEFKEKREEAKKIYKSQREELKILKDTDLEAYELRKEELKELRDSKREEYKEFRDTRYDEHKEIRDERSDELKELRDARYEELKEQREAKEEELKEQRESEEEDEK